MAKTMLAVFSDSAYEAFQNGEAVDNNGFRSKNGTFYHDQPTYIPINEDQDQSNVIGEYLLAEAAATVTFQIILPLANRFAQEKIYPFLAAKWDEFLEKRSSKKQPSIHPTTKSPAFELKIDRLNLDTSDKSNRSRVINLANYRKMA